MPSWMQLAEGLLGPVPSWMQLAEGLPGPRWVGCSCWNASHHPGPTSGTTWMQLRLRPPRSTMPLPSWMQLAESLPGLWWVGCSLERATQPRPDVRHDLDAAQQAASNKARAPCQVACSLLRACQAPCQVGCSLLRACQALRGSDAALCCWGAWAVCRSWVVLDR